ncbi:hypothetical protein PACTADRAFT_70269 [Pachysolen tannophilus NRRL Y-2460]|uniref:CDC45-like protein n=1 Tax=Pachysolen tannophilus NRRL Y-2460 TaxID=669874 RepID=A0A1E4TTI3_PACTA|nr:hypothetical protein PACTADRAFT_70269 [Pachysolen tannophilus NRRL Y-2460]
MYLNPSEFSKAFEDIKSTSLSHSTCKLVIFASCLNVDAICASKILTAVLKKNLISFQLIPVVGYSDLKLKFSNLDMDIRNVVILGCGAMVDLETYLEIDNESTDERKIYVIDGQRPWNLDNIFGSHTIVCFDDGLIEEKLEKEKAAYMVLVSIDSEAEEEDDDEEEEEEEEEEIQDDDENSSQGKRKIQSTNGSSSKKRKLFLDENEKIIENYYNMGTTTITSISLQIYTLLSTIGETSLEPLWLTIVGTSTFIQQFPNIYDRIFPVLKDEVIRLEQSNIQNRQNTDFYNGNNMNNTNNTRTPDTNNLIIDKDYSLFLLRHWNLYNSFFYSNLVNSKLQLYTVEGRKNLNKLFAKMGISLSAANQNWKYLDIDLKKKLNFIFQKYLKFYDLEKIIKDGFIKNFGYKGSISANEFAEAVTALLEYNHDIKINKNNLDAEVTKNGIGEHHNENKRKQNGTNNGNYEEENDDADSDADNVETDDDEAQKVTRLTAKREAQYITNFWKSFDSLSNFELILKGLKIAKIQQKLIFDKGFEIFEKRSIKNLRVFRLVVLKDDLISINNNNNNYGNNFFQNPLMLTKLGNWLLECCSELDSQKNKDLPLIIAALDPETDTYLLCGLSSLNRKNDNDGDTKRENHDKNENIEENNDENLRINKFSQSFQKIVQSTGVAAKIDSFDGTVITIKKEDLQPFLERLCFV